MVWVVGGASEGFVDRTNILCSNYVEANKPLRPKKMILACAILPKLLSKKILQGSAERSASAWRPPQRYANGEHIYYMTLNFTPTSDPKSVPSSMAIVLDKFSAYKFQKRNTSNAGNRTPIWSVQIVKSAPSGRQPGEDTLESLKATHANRYTTSDDMKTRLIDVYNLTIKKI